MTSQVSHENDVFPPTFDVCDDLPLTTTTSFWVSELSEEASDSLASSEDDESWLISIFEVDELSPPEVEAEHEAEAEDERDEDKEDSMVEESSNLMMMLLPLLFATAAETASLTSFFLQPSEKSLWLDSVQWVLIQSSFYSFNTLLFTSILEISYF